MQMRLNPKFFVALFTLGSLCRAAVIDRIAVVIDKKVITESEVLDELRLTDFLNSQPLDLGPAARRSAAEHLIDQELIRNEIELSGFTQPPAAEADGLLRKFRQEHFHSLAAYHAALEKYGVTEEQLKRGLLWELTAIRFTDFRFRSGLAGPNSQSADRTEETAASVDEQLDSWLKQARGDVKIVFNPEAYQ
jgi:hypothetical protein